MNMIERSNQFRVLLESL